MRNAPEYIAAWLGIVRAGMIEVPVHVDYRESLLTHVLDESGARVLVCDAEFVDRLAGLPLARLERIVVRGIPPEGADRLRPVLDIAELLEAEPPGALPDSAADDVTCICYTSGTTGPSKGVVLSHSANLKLASTVVELMSYDSDDVLYSMFPLSHVNAKYTSVLAALLTGAQLVLDERFSASRHWDTMRTHGVTAFNYMGSLVGMLLKQPERPNDRHHAVRRSYGAACPADLWTTFEERFGVRLFEHYGMSEIGIATMNTATERRIGSCGRPAPYLDLRIADDDGRELPPGEAGEILVRPLEPGIVLQEYWARPDATIAAFRDLWFHTGDRGRRDEDGFYYFVDRLKDCIRRRGENISSWEIESVLSVHPNVVECAAYGVPDDLGEDEAMVAVVLRPGVEPDARALMDFCQQRLARFAVPRYIAFRTQLPKTHNQRTQKFALRSEGVPEGTYDRVADGYEVER
jgi:crotonobetaine/carnitine-CoA ligase